MTTQVLLAGCCSRLTNCNRWGVRLTSILLGWTKRWHNGIKEETQPNDLSAMNGAIVSAWIATVGVVRLHTGVGVVRLHIGLDSK